MILMIRKPDLLNITQLKEAVNQVFSHKEMEKKFPLKYKDSSYQNLELLWKQHQMGLRQLAKDLSLPNSFKELVSELNAFLSEHIN